MKIAYLVERLDPSRGGAERYSWDFTAKLAAAGRDVHVFCRHAEEAPPGVTVRPVESRGLLRGRRTMSFARDIAGMLAKETFDVVHGTGWTYSQDVFQPHGGVYAASVSANHKTFSGLRWFFESFRGWRSHKEWVYRHMEWVQYAWKPALVFVAVSNMVKRDMENFAGLMPEKIRVVYNGVDTERFHPRNRAAYRDKTRGALGVRDDEVVLLIVAHNFRLKGVPDLVRCVTAKEFPPCRLLVVGGGRSGKLRRFADSRIPGRVVFLGALSDPVPYYAAADIYVHPTNYDPCSLVALEALASGLPVVTTTMNGASELMTNGREGFVIAPGDRAALDGAMRSLMERPRRAEMGAAARALAQKHTLDDNVREMLAVYDEVIRLKGRA